MPLTEHYDGLEASAKAKIEELAGTNNDAKLALSTSLMPRLQVLFERQKQELLTTRAPGSRAAYNQTVKEMHDQHRTQLTQVLTQTFEDNTFKTAYDASQPPGTAAADLQTKRDADQAALKTALEDEMKKAHAAQLRYIQKRFDEEAQKAALAQAYGYRQEGDLDLKDLKDVKNFTPDNLPTARVSLRRHGFADTARNFLTESSAATHVDFQGDNVKFDPTSKLACEAVINEIRARGFTEYTFKLGTQETDINNPHLRAAAEHLMILAQTGEPPINLKITDWHGNPYIPQAINQESNAMRWTKSARAFLGGWGRTEQERIQTAISEYKTKQEELGKQLIADAKGGGEQVFRDYKEEVKEEDKASTALRPGMNPTGRT